MLRERYKAPNTKNLRERRVEKIASRRRKEVSKHEKSLPDIADQLNQVIVERYLRGVTKTSLNDPVKLS